MSQPGRRARSAPLSREAIRATLRGEFPYLGQAYGVTRVALYGSYARGTPTAQSDIDLLVELSRPPGLEFVSLALYLESRLGRKVDLATFDDLRRSLSTPRRRHIALEIGRSLTDVDAAA
jgi:uncharacterized protein